MRMWFTADLHFGHELVSRLRGFGTTERHDEVVCDMWRNVVEDGDRVFVLGDVTMRTPEYALGLLDDLPGEKHLIAGNHDGVHPMHRNSIRFQPRWLETFETVQPFGQVRVGGRKVLMSHFPYSHDRHEARYMQWRLRDHGALLLHGHTHEKEKFTSDRELHVGLDAWGLHLVPFGEVAKWVAER